MSKKEIPEKAVFPEIRVYSLDTPTEVYRVLGADESTVLVESLYGMTPRYEKILPVFSHKIELIESNKTTIWLLNKGGYMKVVDDPKHTLYKFDNPMLLLKTP